MQNFPNRQSVSIVKSISSKLRHQFTDQQHQSTRNTVKKINLKNLFLAV